MEVKIYGSKKKQWMTAFFMAMWTIWKCRNNAILEEKEISKEEASQFADFWLEQWTRGTL